MSDTETNIEELNNNNLRKGFPESKEKILRKCIRKGDIIYYSNDENINMVQNNQVFADSTKKSSFTTEKQLDKVLSGESLNKTFTFEQSNNEETEKCIAFWKSVMEKHLTPIKCTIIERNKNEQPSVVDKEKSVEKIPSQKIVSDTNEAEKIHEEYRNMWLTTLRQLQSKKLNEIKLIGKSHCKMCDSINSSPVADDDACKVDEDTIKKQITDLNDWKSPSLGKKYLGRTKVSSVSQKSVKQSISNKDGKSLATNQNESKNVDINQKTAIPLVKENYEKNLAPDTKTYKHINVIEEKKKSGAYSQWRSNMLKSPCNCGYSDCDCNTNPAILAVETNELISGSDKLPQKDTKGSSEATTDKKCTENSKELSTESQSPVTSKSEDQPVIQESSVTFKEYPSALKQVVSKKLLHRTLSVMINCNCGTSSCDCTKRKEALSKVVLDKTDLNMPLAPHRKSILKKRSSLEIYRQKYSPKTPHSERDLRVSIKTDTIFYREHSSETNMETNGGSSDIWKEKNAVTTTPSGILCKFPRENKTKKKLSIMLNNCTCSENECDCARREFLCKENVPQEEIDRTPIVPASTMSLKKVDSLELIRKKSKMAVEHELKNIPSIRVIYSPQKLAADDSISPNDSEKSSELNIHFDISKLRNVHK